jgi:hypothetical protein
MEKPKPAASDSAQDLREQQQVMEWLDDIGIGFTTAAPPKRVSTAADNRERSNKNAA